MLFDLYNEDENEENDEKDENEENGEKYIAKLIPYYDLKIPEKFLIYLRDDINDMNFSQKKIFFRNSYFIYPDE